MSAATCLSLLANTVQDAIVPPVVQFVEEYPVGRLAPTRGSGYGVWKYFRRTEWDSSRTACEISFVFLTKGTASSTQHDDR